MKARFQKRDVKSRCGAHRCFQSVALLAVLVLGSSTTVGAQTVSFMARRDFVTGNRPVSVAVGDFNGDGVEDLAVANGSSNNISVLLGNGDGSFQPATSFRTGKETSSLVECVKEKFRAQARCSALCSMTRPKNYAASRCSSNYGSASATYGKGRTAIFIC